MCQVWTGCPIPAVSHRSTRCWRGPASTRLDRLPNSDGISPPNWLLERSKNTRLDRLPNSGGISPLSPLSERSSSMTRSMASVLKVVSYRRRKTSPVVADAVPCLQWRVAQPVCVVDPVRDRPWRCKAPQALPCPRPRPRQAGALRRRAARVRRSRFGPRCLSSAGTQPLNWLLESASAYRLWPRRPSSGGISPLSWLPRSHSHSRMERLPSSGGIGPLNLLWARDSVSQVPEEAQFRWYRAAQLVVRERQRAQVVPERPPSSGGIGPLNSFWRRGTAALRLTRPFLSSGGIGPLNSLAPRDQNSSRLDETAQLRRHRAAQLVATEVTALSRLARLAQFRRYRAAQLVVC